MSTPSSAGIRARAVRGLPKRSKRYSGERQCSHPGCITKLSAYNRSDTCYVHAQFKTPRLRGRKVA
jgi:hypothetical protein